MGKITVAKRNEELRKRFIEELGLEKIEDLLKVANTKFMKNIEFEGEFYPVRLDIVVPKIDENDTCQLAEDFAEEYEKGLQDKAKAKAEKEALKAKKIARDKKLREKNKKEEA